ncbi:MAG: SDR family NAD(P)-dependent oxidoreductase [Actinobacteria bacterium]|nr:SDR family NAD(P)-dependent oxidoreductase [Actinomycetota bacterium]
MRLAHPVAVAVAGRQQQPLDESVRLIEAEGGKPGAITADVSSSAEVARLVSDTVHRHGGLHVAFNNAGMLAAGPVAGMAEDDWERQLAVNVTGTFLAMKHEIGHMRDHGGGVIVNTASIVGAHVRLPDLGGFIVGHDLVLDGAASA